MSITRPHFDGPITFVCDDCGEEDATHSSDFDSAFAKAKSHGFRAVKVKGEWQHRCADCAR